MAIKAFRIPSWFDVRFVDQSGGCERPHTHSSLIVSAVSEGYISLQINDTETCLKKGIVAAVGPNVLHCVRSYSQCFSGIYVLEIFNFPAISEGFNPYHFQMFGNQLFLDKEGYDTFVNLCILLLSPIRNTAKIKFYSDWVHSLFVNRFNCYPSHIKDNPEDSLFADRIRIILDEHNGESPPFEEIAQLFGRSKEHCNRVFKQAYKLSIQAYFLNKKAARARKLLNSGESLSEIALQCGFYDQSHLNRVFKDIYQISPAKYRKAIQG